VIWPQQMVAAVRRHANDVQRNKSPKSELEELPLVGSPSPLAGGADKGLPSCPMAAPPILDQDEMKCVQECL
jgi:hypothetical protein